MEGQSNERLSSGTRREEMKGYARIAAVVKDRSLPGTRYEQVRVLPNTTPNSVHTDFRRTKSSKAGKFHLDPLCGARCRKRPSEMGAPPSPIRTCAPYQVRESLAPGRLFTGGGNCLYNLSLRVSSMVLYKRQRREMVDVLRYESVNMRVCVCVCVCTKRETGTYQKSSTQTRQHLVKELRYGCRSCFGTTIAIKRLEHEPLLQLSSAGR
ncbi:hypothetical protein HDV57DRAFT_186762 [Trichoderma longibrachiatum]